MCQYRKLFPKFENLKNGSRKELHKKNEKKKNGARMALLYIKKVYPTLVSFSMTINETKVREKVRK